jgi:hypothetical protein
MGALVFAVGVLCVSILIGDALSGIDEAQLMRLQEGDMNVLSEVDPLFITRLMAAFAVSVAISGTLTFFSIPLVWFRGRRLWPAIGEGLRALVVNWKSMLVLGGVLALASLPVVVLSALLLQVAALGGVAYYLATGLVMLLVLAFQLVLFGTQYCAFREIFGLDEAPRQDAPAPPDDDGQLVA